MMTQEDRCTQLESILEDVLDCFEETSTGVSVETDAGGVVYVCDDTAIVLQKAHDVLIRGEEEDDV